MNGWTGYTGQSKLYPANELYYDAFKDHSAMSYHLWLFGARSRLLPLVLTLQNAKKTDHIRTWKCKGRFQIINTASDLLGAMLSENQ